MANRFTDTDLWKKKWFRTSSPHIKCLFRYLVDNCNHAGILDVDLGLMSYMIGEEITSKDLDSLDFLFQYLTEDKIFMPSFVEYQYKVSSYSELNESNNAHKSVINQLKKYNLLGANEGLKCTSRGAQDKDKDKDKELVKVKVMDKDSLIVFDFWNANTATLPKCRKLTADITSAINGILADSFTVEDITRSITTYNHLFNGDQYEWDWSWSLYEFLKRKNACRKFADITDDKPYLKNKGALRAEDIPMS